MTLLASTTAWFALSLTPYLLTGMFLQHFKSCLFLASVSRIHNDDSFWRIPTNSTQSPLRQAHSGILVCNKQEPPFPFPLTEEASPCSPQNQGSWPSMTSRQRFCWPLHTHSAFRWLCSLKALTHQQSTFPNKLYEAIWFTLPSLNYFAFVSTIGKPCSCTIFCIAAFLLPSFALTPCSFSTWTS